MHELEPETRSFGYLDPPSRRPPTAVGADAPEPEPEPDPDLPPWRRPGWNSLGLRGEIAELIRWNAHRLVDRAADAIRGRRSGESDPGAA